MSRRKYFSWTDEKRAELREFVNSQPDIKQAFKDAAVLFSVSENSCIGAYNYVPKKSITTEVDPEDLEPRKERVMQGRAVTLKDLREMASGRTVTESIMQEETEKHTVAPVVTKTWKMKIDVHNDINNDCLVIHINDSVTVLKIGDIIVTLEV